MENWRERIVDEVSFRAIKSQGPGGQNVNKVSSAAQLTWDLSKSTLFSEAEKIRIAERLFGGESSKRVLSLRSQKFRDLPANKRACVEKLVTAVERALKKERPRVKTKVPHSAKRKRQDIKRKRSDLKKLRAAIKD